MRSQQKQFLVLIFYTFFIYANAMQETSTSGAKESAAIILGGYILASGPGSFNPPKLNSAEIFGCDGGSRFISDFPNFGFSHGGLFVDDEQGGYILVCGGKECDSSNSGSCLITDKCYQWRPQYNIWVEFDDMEMARLGPVMANLPNIYSGDNENQTHPVVMGWEEESEIIDNNEWILYKNIPSRTWFNSYCFLAFYGKIYYIGNEVTEIDPRTWEIKTLGTSPLPSELKSPLKCAGTVINGNHGIFTKRGDFFNLVNNEWESYTAPPQIEVAYSVNAMWGHEMRPTIFGTAKCNALDECVYNQVIQYNTDSDVWEIIGSMLVPRQFHEVIEVPKVFCDLLPSLMTAVPPPTVSNDDIADKQDTAAVLIGGYYGASPTDILDSLEIFGCTGKNGEIIEQAPDEFYQMGSKFMDDGGYILNCGGYVCPPDWPCYRSDNCYEWRPKSEKNWEPVSTLNDGRAKHIIANLRNIDQGGNGVFPTIIGDDITTEMLDPLSNQWSLYHDVSSAEWNTFDCLIYFQDMIYTVTDDGVIQLDPSDWKETVISVDAVPVDDLGSRRCAGTFIGETPAIFTLKGNIFNLNTNQWDGKAYMPQLTYFSSQNSIWSYNGRPTIFGAPMANALNEISYHQVIQYIEEDDEWIMLGDMAEPRRMHEVVEVPKTFCDDLFGDTN